MVMLLLLIHVEYLPLLPVSSLSSAWPASAAVPSPAAFSAALQLFVVFSLAVDVVVFLFFFCLFAVEVKSSFNLAPVNLVEVIFTLHPA